MEEVKLKEIAEEREKNIADVTKQMNEVLNLESIKKLIKNNIIEFENKGTKYRVQKPTYKEKQEVYKNRCEKQAQLLREKTSDGTFRYMSEKDLKNLYLERGIDIDKMRRQIDALRTKELDLSDKLGKALKEQAPENQLKIYRDEIQTLRETMGQISVDRTNLLEISIEQQLLVYIYAAFAVFTTEKLVIGKDLGEGNKDPDTWVKVWTNIDEFYNADQDLVAYATTYSTLLINEQTF